MRGMKEVMGLLVLAGLGVSSVNAGVLGSIWIEVDNRVATMGDAAGIPTGLDGVRTFDLFVIVTPETEIFVADFGFVARMSNHRPMWTTQAVYQNSLGGDTQSRAVGALRVEEFAALEFDTYLGLGMVDTKIVRNTNILNVDWSRQGFTAAWYVVPTPSDHVVPAQADEFDRIFLARISVYADGSFGDYTVHGGLGGAFFLGGRGRSGEIGQQDPRSGLFWARNAFDGPIPFFSGSSDDGIDDDFSAPVDDAATDNPATDDQASDDFGDEEAWTPIEVLEGDFNHDDVVDAADLLILQRAYGTLNPVYDLTGDLLIEEQDIRVLMILIAGTFDPSDAVVLTPKEKRKAAKRYNKLMKKAEKQVARETKQHTREVKKAARRAEKARKKREKRERKNKK